MVYVLNLADLFYKTAKKDLNSILKELDEIETFEDRIKFAKKNLSRIAAGSSRVVFRHGDQVVKLALNNKGIAQNKAECRVQDKDGYLNKIDKKSKKNLWVVAKFLKKITEKEFEKLTDVNFKDFGEAIRYGLKNISGNTDKDKPKNFEDISKTDIYKEMKRLGNKYDLMGGDMARISSWSKIDGHPILIDSGLTRKVFDEYYDSNSSTSSKT